MSYVTNPLISQHNRKDFDCGVPSLNRYIQGQASQDLKRRIAACFVFRDDDEVLGYYTLSSSTVGIEELPVSLQRKLPKYPQVPATLMGRLTVDKKTRGRRLGETLLFDSLFRALDASRAVASFAVLVDDMEVEPDPLTFYEQYGFTRLAPPSRTLFIPMATVAKLLRTLSASD